MVPVVSFDAGQTLVELDLDFLARRLVSRGISVDAAALSAAAPAAWQLYETLSARGHGRVWHGLMTALLEGAGVPAAAAVADWLQAEQPRANLFRKPISGVIEVVRELSARGIALVVVSNSEGRLAELLAEIGLASLFPVIIDSGRLGIEKPDRRIFDHALAQLGRAPDDPAPRVHIGDSYTADIAGALGAGWKAVWYGRQATAVADPRVAIAGDGGELRAALERFGV